MREVKETCQSPEHENTFHEDVCSQGFRSSSNSKYSLAHWSAFTLRMCYVPLGLSFSLWFVWSLFSKILRMVNPKKILMTILYLNGILVSVSHVWVPKCESYIQCVIFLIKFNIKFQLEY